MEITYKDFCMWQLYLLSNGGLTLQDRIYHTFEPKLADLLVIAYAKAGVKTKRGDFLTSFRLRPVGHNAKETKETERVKRIKEERWRAYLLTLHYEKTDPERAAKRYEYMPQWSRDAYDEYKRTGNKDVINNLQIN